MDPIVLTVGFKGIAALLAIGGGLAIARYGFHLYKNGAGTGRDRLVFDLGSMKIQAHSVGSAVMATAFLWAWAGVALSPNLDKTSDEVRVYSLQTPELNVRTYAVPSTSPKTLAALKHDPEALETAFKQALVETKGVKMWNIAAVNGVQAKYDLQSIAAVKLQGGDYMLRARLDAPNASANVTYEPMAFKNKLVFVPVGLEGAKVHEKEDAPKPKPRSG